MPIAILLLLFSTAATHAAGKVTENLATTARGSATLSLIALAVVSGTVAADMPTPVPLLVAGSSSSYSPAQRSYRRARKSKFSLTP